METSEPGKCHILCAYDTDYSCYEDLSLKGLRGRGTLQGLLFMMSCSAPAWGNKNLQSCTLGSSWAQSLSCTRQGNGCRIPPRRYHGLWTCSASGPVRSVAVCCCLGQASKRSSCWTGAIWQATCCHGSEHGGQRLACMQSSLEDLNKKVPQPMDMTASGPTSSSMAACPPGTRTTGRALSWAAALSGQ